MTVDGSHFWFVHCFGSYLCFDASSFGCFLLAPSVEVSAPPSMIEVGSVVLSAVLLVFVIPCLGRHDIQDVLSWGCHYCLYLVVSTLLSLVNLLDLSTCSSGRWSSIWRCSRSRKLTFTHTPNPTLRFSR